MQLHLHALELHLQTFDSLLPAAAALDLVVVVGRFVVQFASQAEIFLVESLGWSASSMRR